MATQSSWVVVGLDNGGNKNNATVLDPAKGSLVDGMIETPSRVTEGPEIAVSALVQAFDSILERTGVARARVLPGGVAAGVGGRAPADARLHLGHGYRRADASAESGFRPWYDRATRVTNW